jgi:hypothetical protein
MVRFDSQRVLQDVRQATTEDLLDRVTAYRTGMEAEALGIMEAELRRRGVGRKQIEDHAQRPVLADRAGVAVKCSYCSRPAIGRSWVWHRLWWCIPVFPRRFNYCPEHVPTV